MKFLCVPCDQPMKLTTVKPPDRGSLSVVYSCAACGYEMAMLTNPYETQVVSSLGVKIEPAADAAGAIGSADPADAAGGSARAASPAPGDAAGGTNKEGGGKCPFAEMIPGLMGEGIATATDGVVSAGAAGSPPAWTDAAVARLDVIPSFVRPIARTGIERFARERGYATIDERVLDEARDFFGM
jgi:hypothetical protein